MVYKVQDITRDVKIAIDQNVTSDILISTGDADTLSMDDIIRSRIVDGVRKVHCEAPIHLLEEGHFLGDSVYWEPMECGWIILPDDFMRLVAFKMSDWERTVYDTVAIDSAMYARQSSRYKGIRGNVQKPVCAIVNRPEGKVLEFYSCNSDQAYVSRGTYLPYPCLLSTADAAAE